MLLSWIATHAVAIAVASCSSLPLVFMFLTAFMTDDQALTIDLWPHALALGELRRGVPTRRRC